MRLTYSFGDLVPLAALTRRQPSRRAVWAAALARLRSRRYLTNCSAIHRGLSVTGPPRVGPLAFAITIRTIVS